MPQSQADIPDLRLKRMNKLMTRFTAPPSMVLTNLFGSDKWDSDTIEWESQIGNRGLTPFVAPDSKAPRVAPIGVASHEAKAACWKEKMYLGEGMLNNLREPGNKAKYYTAQKQLSKNSYMISNRSDRRVEWMFAKMLNAGSMSYLDYNSTKQTVDYGISDEHIVTLAANRKWDDGVSRNILEDIFDIQLTMSNASGAILDYALFTSEILKLMIFDPGIQTLLSKSNYGQGDLFTNPVGVLGSLLSIKNMVLYDEQYQIRANLTAVVTADSTTTISVDDTLDFEVGGTLRFYDVSAKSYEDEVISAVNENAGTLEVTTAPSTSYKAAEDIVYMTKKFLPTNKFLMFASSHEGQKIAEFITVPFGINGMKRQWGKQVDKWPVRDPAGMFVLVENRGLPVLYNEDCVYVLTVT
jgi:hypothetical protein